MVPVHMSRAPKKQEGHDMFVVSHTHKVQEFAVFWFSFFKTAVSHLFRALVFCFQHGWQEEPRGGCSSQGCSQDEGRCSGKGLEEAHCCREGSFLEKTARAAASQAIRENHNFRGFSFTQVHSTMVADKSLFQRVYEVLLASQLLHSEATLSSPSLRNIEVTMIMAPVRCSCVRSPTSSSRQQFLSLGSPGARTLRMFALS